MSEIRHPQRDVYSGDLTAPSGPPGVVRVLFEVRSDADPGALARVAATLALANVAPLRMTCEREAPSGLVITAVVDGVTSDSAELILRKLQQLSVVVEASKIIEERPGGTGVPSPA